MIAAFVDVPGSRRQYFENREMCDVEIPLGQIQLPYFSVPAGYDEISYLEHLAHEGCQKRYGKTYEEIDKVRKTE